MIPNTEFLEDFPIQEIGREKVQAGEKFSAAYIIGFFDSIEEIEEAYDRHHGWSDIILKPSFGEAQTFHLL